MEIVPTKMASKKTSLPSFDEAKEVVANWRPEQELFFIDILKDMVIQSGDTKVTSSFKKTECLEIRKRYYSKWGLKYELKAFKNKYQTLKDRFREFKQLVEKSSGTGWHPVLVTLDVSETWWEEYAKTHPKVKNVKRFRSLGYPEYKSLEVIFGDTIATGHLQASANHEFNSTDEENSQKEATAESPSIAEFVSVGGANDNEKNDQSSQSKGPARSKKRERGSDLSEAVMMLAKASNARAESRRKFTITECIDVVEAMNVNIGRKAYGKLMTLLENKVWREGFLHMPDARKRDILQSIEEGDL